MGTFSTGGNYRAADPRLVAIAQAAAARSPYNVVLFSGERDGNSNSQHSGGNAVDLVLIDPQTGREIPNLGAGGDAFNAYQSFANTMRATQQEIAPELSNTFRWGGYFGPTGLNPTGLDLMHFDLGPTQNMALGTWDGGLNDRGRQFVAQAGTGQTYSASGRTTAPMAYAASQNAPAGQAAISAVAGPGQDVTAQAPAPGAQRLFMPIRDAIAARQAGGTPRLDELRNIRERRMAGEHPLLDRLANFFQSLGGTPQPSASAPRPPAPIPNVNRPTGGGGQAAPATGSTYTIRSGDTLSAIAARLGTTVQALAQANGIANPDRIQAGAVLTIPGQQPAPTPAPASPPLPVANPSRMASASPPLPVPNPQGQGAPVPLPRPRPPAAQPIAYNPQAPMNYGLPITAQGPASISAPPPGSLMTGSLTPTGPAPLGPPNPQANLNWGIGIQPNTPATVPTPSVPPNLGPMLAGYAPGNGVGVPTTPVSRGVLADAAPPPNPMAGLDIQSILASLPQASLSMPGWGAGPAPTSGPGAGGRPVTVSPTTTVPGQRYNNPGERERAMANGLMPAGRDNFSSNSFRRLPAFYDEPNPMTWLPNGTDGPRTPVSTTSPQMPFGPPSRGIPVPEFWRRLFSGMAGV